MLALLLLACADRANDTDDTSAATDACAADPVGRVSLPADEPPHDEPVEWWYWTGHLQDEQSRWYGFEEVFFVFSEGTAQVQMSHVAVTDVAADTFTYDARFGGWDGTVPDEGFAFTDDDWTASGADGDDHLVGAVGDYALDLSLHATTPPVLQHGDGYTDYDFGGYTYYYSRPRMTTTGTLTVGGEARPVTGESWFDHQWGDLGTASDDGWDWFAVQLEDGRSLMLFQVRTPDGGTWQGGSLTGADCVTEELDDFTVTPTGTWTNAGGCDYPSGWDIVAGGLSLAVTPVRADQELSLSYDSYWEGASTVSGDATGRAYVELTGYCE
jgi:predicted secreted hydrolase